MKQYIIRKKDDKWIVLTEDGSKVLGTHDTEESAKKQLAAIEASSKKNELYDFIDNKFGVQIDFENVATISDVDIFAVGTWRGVNSPPEGDTYSQDDLNSMVEAFNAGVVKPKIKITHGSDKEQVDIGEISNLRVVANKLVGDFVNVPKGLHELMKKGLFGKRSAEVIWDLKDKAGKVWKRVVKAVALLAPGQRPAVGALSDGYQFEALYCYQLFEDQLKDNIEDQEEIKMFQSLLKKYGVNTLEELDALLDSKIKEVTEKIKELDEKDKTVAVYQQEKAALREQRLREFVERMKKEGKILPKEEAEILSYLTPLSVLEDQLPLEHAMKQIESGSKKVDLETKSRTTEQKYEVNTEASPQEEVNRLAQQYIADQKAKDYQTAVGMVATSHPELWKSYLAKR